MPVSPARAAAFDILLKVEREHSYASDLLHSSRFAKLSSADHGLVTELVMGVLRWKSLLDERLSCVSAQKLDRLDDEVLAALRLAAYQLQVLSRVPARAAIFESVELVKAARKRSASSFVNAVLRKLAPAASAGPEPQASGKDAFANINRASDPLTLARNAAHPEWLVTRWAHRYGFETTRRICAHNQKPPVTTIHVHDNPSVEELARGGVELGPGHLLRAARTVLAGDVTRTRTYREGRISIQGEASLLIALLVGRGQRILDCCAAPGGKTALIARRNPSATVIASDLHPHRARLLRSFTRSPNVGIVAADARQLPFSVMFDRILADVPCSGTGTLARNPEIKWRLRPQDMADLQSQQIAILTSVLTRLAPDGRLVYSTCSLEPEENEAVVEAALAGSSEFSIANCRKELERLRQSGELCADDVESLLDGPYLRTIPGEHPCDGFFATIIERQ